MLLLRELLALCLSVGATFAHPSLPEFHPPVDSLDARQVVEIAAGPYVPPTADQSRGPCPGMNTLANHGYLNRNGRDISRDQMIEAFSTYWNINETAIDTAITNAFIVCDFVTGTNCTHNKVLNNLTLLAEPHAFEHDHSFSRDDYDANKAGLDYQDNVGFDSKIFGNALDVLDGATHVDFSAMNEIRLQSEYRAMKNDRSGWFLEAKSTQEFEAGFVFAVMSDFTLADYITNPQIRVDWWNYWFTNESFPYELGWQPPPTPRNKTYVLSVSSQILAAKVTSTPSPLPSDALSPTIPPTTLTLATDTTTYAVPTFAPYYATGPTVGQNDKRQADSTQAVSTEAPSPSLVGATVGVVPLKNPYVETLAISDIVAQQAAGASMVALGQTE